MFELFAIKARDQRNVPTVSKTDAARTRAEAKLREHIMEMGGEGGRERRGVEDVEGREREEEFYLIFLKDARFVRE